MTENKKKYGFEADPKKLANVLSTRLFEFINLEDFNEFCHRLFEISKIELILRGIKNPSEQSIEQKQQQYFINLIPSIYDSLLIDFQKKPKTYKYYKGIGHLDISKQYSFYTLNEITDKFEKEIIKKYKKDKK